MDLHTRKIVGWAMADHLRAELQLAALAMAIAIRRPAAGLIHHSDRGAQYASAEYRKMMHRSSASPIRLMSTSPASRRRRKLLNAICAGADELLKEETHRTQYLSDYRKLGRSPKSRLLAGE